MVSRSSILRFAAIAGLAASAMYCLSAAMDHLWANLVISGLILAGCAFFLLRSEDVYPVSDPMPAQLSTVDPLSVLLDQVPIPLLKYSSKTGLHTLNRAARGLFHSDDLVAGAPLPLIEAIRNAQPGARSALRLFESSYAIGVSEIAISGETVWLVSLTDIQSEVRVAEATALRDLLRVLSHEIMNSLTPVSSLAETARAYLAGETSPAAGAAIEALDVLSQRASGLARFVEAYRSMARLPDPVMRPTDLATLVHDIVRVFGQSTVARNVTLDFERPAGTLHLDLDETLFSQALLNVLTNAAEATETNRGARRIQVSAFRTRDEVRVQVADNGGGVPLDLRGKIFHAFITTKPSGTGTGLNLARQIALAHGGDLVLMDGGDAWSTIFSFVFKVPPQVAV